MIDPIEQTYILFGQEMKQARKKKKMSIRALSEVVDLSEAAIWKIENGEMRLLLHNVMNILCALEMHSFAYRMIAQVMCD